MMAKIVKGKSFKGVVNYILDEEKNTQVIDANGLRIKNKAAIIRSFVTQASLNNRISNSVCHISLDFSIQDVEKLSNDLMVKIAGDYMKKMGIVNTQYIIGRHFDKDHPHIHLLYNRIDNNGKTITDSNDRFRSEKICKELTRRYGLYFASGKENVKKSRLREPDKTKYEIYDSLKTLVPECQNWNHLMVELKKEGIETHFKTKVNSDKIQGIRFQKNGYFFNGSKIDRAFSYLKIDSQLSLNIKAQTINESYPNNSSLISRESLGATLGGISNSSSKSKYDEDEAEFWKKKKKRKFERYM